MILIRPSKLYRDNILDFKKEFSDNNEKICGGELLDILDFDEWLGYVQKNSCKDSVSSDWVLTDIFLALHEDVIVGVISFRHNLNDFLRNWGHVGYSVRPSMRGKGIATWMFKEILAYAKRFGLNEIQMSSYEDNVASVRVILKNGGVFIRSFNYLEKKVNIYIINLNESYDIDNNC